MSSLVVGLPSLRSEPKKLKHLKKDKKKKDKKEKEQMSQKGPLDDIANQCKATYMKFLTQITKNYDGKSESQNGSIIPENKFNSIYYNLCR